MDTAKSADVATLASRSEIVIQSLHLYGDTQEIAMRFVTFRGLSGPRVGVLTDDQAHIVDIADTAEQLGLIVPAYLTSMLSIIENGERALDEVRNIMSESGRATLPIESVRLLAPIPRPVQIRDFLCFEKHLIQGFDNARRVKAELSADPAASMQRMEEQGILRVPDEWYDVPLYYRVNPANVCGQDTDVHWPTYSCVMDFEFEYACIIGRTGRDIAPEKAREHIFGYTILNDLSARDEQVKVMPGQLGPGKGKDFDNSKPLGPCLVTADEIGDPYDLRMTARLNGEIFVEASTAEMNWRFEDCIAYVSQGETVEAGEVFGSGTVGGGCALEVGRTVCGGDVIELEIEKIGTLKTRLSRPSSPSTNVRTRIAPINTRRRELAIRDAGACS